MKNDLVSIAVLSLLLTGCPTTPTAQLRGAVQKGPFVVGSSLEAAQLDAAGNATGAVFSTTTTDDLGSFSLSVPAGQPLRLEASGGYYNEVTGQLSVGTLTLRAFFAGDASSGQVFVNLVTHLSALRVERLVSQGTAFDAAVTQAESELRAALAIVPASLAIDASGTEMNLAGGDTPSNAYLFGVSTVLAQAAVERTPSSPDTGLQELANMIALDLADDGAISSTLDGFVAAGLLAVRTASVEEALQSRFALLGSSAVVPDLDAVLDQDRDGLVNELDNCPRAANPGQEDADGDGRGDACSSCADEPEACLGAPCDFSDGSGCGAGELCAQFRAYPGHDETQATCAESCTLTGGCRAGWTCAPANVNDGGTMRGDFVCVPDVGDALPGASCADMVHGDCEQGACLTGTCVAFCGRAGDPTCPGGGACGEGDMPGLLDLVRGALSLEESRTPDLGLCTSAPACTDGDPPECEGTHAIYCAGGARYAFDCGAEGCGASGCNATCTPGEVVACLNADTSLVCGASGDRLEAVACAAGRSCTTGTYVGCAGPVCVPDAGYCDDMGGAQFVAHRCNADGTAETVEECGPGQGCTDGLCDACTPGSFQMCLSPDAAALCDFDGMGVIEVPCMGFGCPACEVCMETDRYCVDDDTRRACNATRDGFDVRDCPAGTMCSAGDCI